MLQRPQKFAFALVGIVSFSFWLGTQFQQFVYEDVCLDMGGGIHPDGYPVCVITPPDPPETEVHTRHSRD